MSDDVPFESIMLSVGDDPLHVAVAGDGDEAVLVVHGLLAAHLELSPVIDGLAGAGYTVFAPDLRGCGQSGGPRGHTSPERAKQDVEAVLDRIEEQGLRTVGAVGHSLGSAYLLYMASHGVDLERLVLAATPATIRGELGTLEYLGYRLGGAVNEVWTRFGMSPIRVPYKVDLTETIDDPERRAEAEQWKFLQETIPLTNVGPLLSVDSVQWARNVSAPSRVLVASNDQVVTREATQSVYDALAGDKDMVEVPGGHSVYLDHGRDKALAATIDWLQG